MTTQADSRDLTRTQTNAAGALLAMVTVFPHLPAPGLRLEILPPGKAGGTYAWGVNVSIHDGLGHFEQWRAALGLDTDDVTAYLDDDDLTNWLQVSGTWSGVPVQIIGYFRFADPGEPQ
ncbi:hypothetical protein ACFYS8_11795 [Kitasatospora sp. NPDC004615]|uniref:hypothetical protein n=1 Tax=Kitasatospora sp. NPDC004615 TaxID=3364017 RepID=UPI0036A96D4C